MNFTLCSFKNFHYYYYFNCLRKSIICRTSWIKLLGLLTVQGPLIGVRFEHMV